MFLGFVGINNPDNRCYINSTLQTLFHTKTMRNHILNMNVNDIYNQNDRILIYDLQNFFRKLQVLDSLYCSIKLPELNC